MKPNPLSDALHFLVQPALTTATYWLLLLGLLMFGSGQLNSSRTS